MSDERLRELTRRAGEDPAREPLLLVELVRAGQLDRSRLELAAYLGHAAACAATGLAPAGDDADLERLFLGLDRFAGAPWISGALARALVAGGRAANEAWALVPREPLEWPARHAEPFHNVTIEAIEDWILDPPGVDAHDIVRSARYLTSIAVALGHVLAGKPRRFRLCARALTIGLPRCPPEAEPAVRAAVRRELIAWALERGDPLDERRHRWPVRNAYWRKQERE